MPQRKRVLLRLDPGVYEAVARWAADDLRSVNSQIEYALRRALREAGRPVRGRRSEQPRVTEAAADEGTGTVGADTAGADTAGADTAGGADHNASGGGARDRP